MVGFRAEVTGKQPLQALGRFEFLCGTGIAQNQFPNRAG
jgi:hypothetical protein